MTMNGVQDPFQRVLAALEPWLDQLVIIGGWAHQLYRLHPAAQPLDYPALMTLDTDVAVPLKLPAGEEDIRARLLAHGFTEEFLGDDRPPATHYHVGGDASGFYVEFLTPLIGSEYDRRQRSVKQQSKSQASPLSGYGTSSFSCITRGQLTSSRMISRPRFKSQTR